VRLAVATQVRLSGDECEALGAHGPSYTPDRAQMKQCVVCGDPRHRRPCRSSRLHVTPQDLQRAVTRTATCGRAGIEVPRVHGGCLKPEPPICSPSGELDVRTSSRRAFRHVKGEPSAPRERQCVPAARGSVQSLRPVSGCHSIPNTHARATVACVAGESAGRVERKVTRDCDWRARQVVVRMSQRPYGARPVHGWVCSS
jgi:hypothetical protein